MTNSELLLASRLMKRAAEEFAKHGCNDTDDELLAGIPEEDQLAMVEEYKKWDNNPDLDHLTFRNCPDWMWMSYFAARLTKVE